MTSTPNTLFSRRVFLFAAAVAAVCSVLIGTQTLG